MKPFISVWNIFVFKLISVVWSSLNVLQLPSTDPFYTGTEALDSVKCRATDLSNLVVKWRATNSFGSFKNPTVHWCGPRSLKALDCSRSSMRTKLQAGRLVLAGPAPYRRLRLRFQVICWKYFIWVFTRGTWLVDLIHWSAGTVKIARHSCTASGLMWWRARTWLRTTRTPTAADHPTDQWRKNPSICSGRELRGMWADLEESDAAVRQGNSGMNADAGRDIRREWGFPAFLFQPAPFFFARGIRFRVTQRP